MPIRLLAALLALLFTSPAAAWWEYGHETVARIAFDAAHPETRAALRKLMAKGALLETPDCPVNTPEKLSYWPDCVKQLGDRYSYASPWHYQNVDICQPFDLKAPCKDGNCVSAQIERTARLLADPKVPVRERLIALAFLVHFVGDLHNPMHAGDRGDRGGNDVKANYGLVGGRTNLHGMWDGYIAERAISTPPGGAQALLASVAPAERPAIAAGTVEDWSREQWEVSRKFAYASLLGDPCGPKPDGRPTLDEAKVQSLIPELRRGIIAGGLRLARLLDEAVIDGKAPGQRDR